MSHSKTMLRKFTFLKMQHAFFSQDPYLGPYVQVIEGDMQRGSCFLLVSPVQTFAESLDTPCLLPGFSQGNSCVRPLRIKGLISCYLNHPNNSITSTAEK